MEVVSIVVAAAGLLLSISNWMYTLLKNRARIALTVDGLWFVTSCSHVEIYYFITISNLSSAHIAISHIRIAHVKPKRTPRTPKSKAPNIQFIDVVHPRKKTKEAEMEPRLTFPLNLLPQHAVAGYVSVRVPLSEQPDYSTPLTVEVQTTRGKALICVSPPVGVQRPNPSL